MGSRTATIIIHPLIGFDTRTDRNAYRNLHPTVRKELRDRRMQQVTAMRNVLKKGGVKYVFCQKKRAEEKATVTKLELPKNVKLVPTRFSDPEPVDGWQPFIDLLKNERVKRVRIGGTMLGFDEKTGDSIGCVGAAAGVLRANGFKVKLIPALCWPHQTLEQADAYRKANATKTT